MALWCQQKRGGGRGRALRHSACCWIIEVQGFSALTEHGQELLSGPHAAFLCFLSSSYFLACLIFHLAIVPFFVCLSLFCPFSHPLLSPLSTRLPHRRPCRQTTCACACAFSDFGGLLVHSLEADWRRADKRSSAAQWMFNGTNCEYLMRGRESHMERERCRWKGRVRHSEIVKSRNGAFWCMTSHSMQTFLFSYQGVKTTVFYVCMFSTTLLLSYSSCPLYLLIIAPPV